MEAGTETAAADAAAKAAGWTPPTRRRFFGLVMTAGVASVAGRALRPKEPATLRSTPSGKTRWIGHC